MIKVLLFAVLAYFMGSLPNGVVIGKRVKGIDIRDFGSGNSGATNAYRVLGPKYGIMVLVADVLKGFIPVMLADMAGIRGITLILIGIVAIVGHSLSLFLNFKGGKGVATSLGVFLYLIPYVMLVVVAAFILVVYTTRYISLASIVGAALLPILTLFMPIREGIDRPSIFIISLLMGLFVIYRHRTNITRLLNGTENKFKVK
ncbi:glycerol-3-phosphate acyltransferase [Propionigenium maris DSM 9537]|uniref:Glycerol-3-phosphate acyltransferase n=1 Tax=Propionigenium maris DSM 9537 TaxID=1123000 RepID=A0A9W6GKK1_9FUSO|nr:glycerol-3-phosphate 1-O-acyltransferase PlsY [Propionigenium maris]GLI55870.1 glycerol-3-phosphate acyltransferase [Propionigenium maris DSM 9537]